MCALTACLVRTHFTFESTQISLIITNVTAADWNLLLLEKRQHLSSALKNMGWLLLFFSTRRQNCRNNTLLSRLFDFDFYVVLRNDVGTTANDVHQN